MKIDKPTHPGTLAGMEGIDLMEFDRWIVGGACAPIERYARELKDFHKGQHIEVKTCQDLGGRSGTCGSDPQNPSLPLLKFEAELTSPSVALHEILHGWRYRVPGIPFLRTNAFGTRYKTLVAEIENQLEHRFILPLLDSLGLSESNREVEDGILKMLDEFILVVASEAENNLAIIALNYSTVSKEAADRIDFAVHSQCLKTAFDRLCGAVQSTNVETPQGKIHAARTVLDNSSLPRYMIEMVYYDDAKGITRF